jgi:hypothetical protein
MEDGLRALTKGVVGAMLPKRAGGANPESASSSSDMNVQVCSAFLHVRVRARSM